MIVKYSRLDRDLEKGLYLDFKLLVEKNENDRIIEIVDEDGTPIYRSPDYVKTGDILYDTAYIDKDYFKGRTTTFKLRSINKDNYVTELSSRIIANSYKISVDNVEVKPIRDVNDNIILFKTYIRWTYDNFSLKDLSIRALLFPIKDEDKDISYDSLPSNYQDSRYIPSLDTIIKARAISMKTVSTIDVTPDKLFSGNYNELKTSIILYRMCIREKDSSQVSYFPEKGAFRYKASNVNEAPIIKLDDISVVRRGDSFQLKINSILRDSNLDDVRYVINDNQGNVIFQQDYYSYTPRIDKIVFDYDTYNFNSLFLKLSAEISDNLNFSYKRAFSYPLFKVSNLRLRRDRLHWDVLNYSNNILKTTVEILDMSNKVVYSGDTMATRLEKESITITDDKPIELLRGLDEENFYRYYKFRIKIRCDEENYTGYVEFKNGTLVSTQHHNAPDIIIYDGKYPDDYYNKDLQGKPMDHLERDSDNNKRIRLIFDLEPVDGSAIGDYCKYQVTDDSGNVIYSSKDNITIPQRVELYVPYDFTKKLYNDIKVQVITEYGNNSENKIEIPSYYIRQAKIVPNTQKISLVADNYYEGEIKITAEVHDLYNEDGDRESVENIASTDIIREQFIFIQNTDETVNKFIRFVPKIYYDNYGNPYKKDALKCRLRIEGSSEEDAVRYKDKYILVEGLLPPIENSKPSVMINYSNNTIDPNTNIMTSLLNASFGDGDGDWINYSISDRYNMIDSKEFFDTGLDNIHTVTAIKKYDLNQLDSSMVQWNLTCFDEEGLYDSVVHKIPLHYISNLIFENNNLQYKCKLFTKKPIITLLEILDDEGYLYAKGKETAVNYLEGFKIVEEAISIKKFKPGNYRYRIKVSSKNENWHLYYPNMNGEVINISQEMINADRSKSDTMTISEIQTLVYNDLTELTTILGQKLKIGTYTDNETTILGRLYRSLNNLSTEKKSETIIELLDIFSNHHDILKIVFNGEYGNHLLRSTYVDDNDMYIEETKGYTNYAMNINNFLYNIEGYPLEFLIKEDKHIPFEKYQTRAFVNGKKVLDHKKNSQILNDGLTKTYLGSSDVPTFSLVEIETVKTILDEAESTMSTINIDSSEVITNLATSGMTIQNVSQYYLNTDIEAYIERNGNRVNLFRYSIRKSPGIITLIIKDSLYIGDKIKIVTSTISERQHLNTDAISGGSSTNATSAKPIYFIPLGFIDKAGNPISMTDTNIKDHLQVYINGYLSVPEEDYTIVPLNDELSLPPIILFKDLLFNNSDVEIYYNNSSLNNSSVFVKKLPTNGGYYYLESNSEYPLVKGMFSVYCNNKKIPSDDIVILNRKYLLFKKNVYTTRVPDNYYIKLNYPDNAIIKKLLELYATYPPVSDNSSLTSLIGAISNKSELLSETNRYDKDEINSGQPNYLVFLKYIFELDPVNFGFIKEMKDLIAVNSELKRYGLDCSRNYFRSGDVITDIKRVPQYFNHDVNIFGSSSLFDNNNFEDNITIYNPSRLLLLSNYIKQASGEIDCSALINDDYDVFLNEGIDISMDYIVQDIELERNK